jgi:diaminohydroxyphosphoribosylaminopyrimidine deaminase/5-amino-6-(5-phosphoribosylamino)uracil reductase
LNRRFFTFHEKKRPYVVLKWAQTLDGFIDRDRRKEDPIQPNWITNEVSRHLVHKWRSEEQAILIGSNTALKDNPGLNVREWHGKDPIRIIIDRDLVIDESYTLIHDPLPVIIFTDQDSSSSRVDELSGPLVEVVRLNFRDNLIRQIYGFLYDRKVISLFVEGGGYTISRFIESGMWDEARVFIGNRLFHSGVKAPALPSREVDQSSVLNDTRLCVFRNV